MITNMFVVLCLFIITMVTIIANVITIVVISQKHWHYYDYYY